VFRGGPILTMGPTGPAEALVVRDGRIEAVGERAISDAAVAQGADVVELDGRTLVPGFIDAHCHLSVTALEAEWLDCTGLDDEVGLAAGLAELARSRPHVEWLRACRWDEATGLQPTRSLLDEVGGDRPVLVVHHTLHQAVANSAALDRLGIGHSSSDVDGVERSPDGEATGLLTERAFGRAHSASVATFSDPEQVEALLVARGRALHRHGITAVHDAAVDTAAEDRYRALASRGELPVSVLAMPAATPFLSNDLGRRLDGPVTGDGDEWFRTGPVKCFADGGVEPAIDVHHRGHRVAFGRRFDDLRATVVEATRRGFRVAVHAMGNVGIESALDAFTDAARLRPGGDHRFRLEHAGLASASLARRAARLGSVGVVQPGFVEHVGRSTAGFDPDDATWLPFATLAEAGVPIAGSSDDPCGPVDPLQCAWLGERRRTGTGIPVTPAESVPVADWLRAYTAGAAFAGGQEHERGSLRPGLRADLVELAPTSTGAAPFRGTATWIDGRRGFGADGGSA